jgi:hypothetical protein
MVPYDLGWYEIEFTRTLTFEAAAPHRTGDYKAKKGQRIKVEIIEDKGKEVVVQFGSAQCATLNKNDFRRLKPVNAGT